MTVILVGSCLYVIEPLFVNCIGFVELSILRFYSHVFSTPRFRRLIYCVFALALIQELVAIVATLLQCLPVQGYWLIEMQLSGVAKCLNIIFHAFGFGIANLVADVIILALPVSIVQRLQLRRGRKISIGAIFLLGGL